MISLKHSLKVISSWTSIVYTVCYIGVAVYPPIRQLFMKYSLHADIPLTSNYFGFGYFISGLILWNVLAVLGTSLFVFLSNKLE